MDKSYILSQYLGNIRIAMKKAGYEAAETRNFLLMTLFSVFCENSGLFLGRPFTALILNCSADELGSRISAFFEKLPPELVFSFNPEKMCADVQNKLISFLRQDWTDVSPAELGKIFLSDGKERTGVFYTADSDIDRILDNLFAEHPDEQLLKESVFLDPASGCGNFLVRTAQRLSEAEISCGILHGISWLNENRFCGIEIDEEAVQVSKAALFIQLRMCRIAFANYIGRLEALNIELPQRILCADALETDWSDFRPDFIVGNPPFISAITPEQRRSVIRATGTADRIDYASAWIIKAAMCISRLTKTKCAFLTTSSVCQGIHVKPVWKRIFDIIKIDFAYRPFKLETDAVQVWCVIFGFSSRMSKNTPKLLYYSPTSHPLSCSNINAYLNPDNDMFLSPSSLQISGYPAMKQGSFEPTDVLTLNSLNSQKEQSVIPAHSFYITADSLLKSEQLFVFENEEQPTADYLVVPRHTSEKRKYLPIGFFENKSLRFSSSVDYIAGADLFLFGLLCSSMHMAFTKYFCGRLEMRYRYSASLIYNNFFIPTPTKEQRNEIISAAKNILKIRETHNSIMTLGEMYKDMPAELDRAHRTLDCLVDQLYNNGRLFLSDVQRVGYLYSKTF